MYCAALDPEIRTANSGEGLGNPAFRGDMTVQSGLCDARVLSNVLDLVASNPRSAKQCSAASMMAARWLCRGISDLLNPRVEPASARDT